MSKSLCFMLLAETFAGRLLFIDKPQYSCGMTFFVKPIVHCNLSESSAEIIVGDNYQIVLFAF